jgi:alpha-galactosidase/6-phospho-beta-glucosidase family protein
VINKKGIQTLHVGSLPSKIMLEQILPEWLDMERNIEAFKSGDRSLLLWSILEGPQTLSYEQAVAALDDYLSMAGHESLQAHFQYPVGAEALLRAGKGKVGG